MLLRLIVNISGPDANGKSVDSSSSSTSSLKNLATLSDGDNDDTGKLSDENLRVR